MLQVGRRYTFEWQIDDGTRYERGVVVGQEGTVVTVQLDTGGESVINLATPRFIRANLQA